ncbi:GNAT family N-acetyltransferase [Amycolatopsis sp. H20-H5]|uniref:GNAT family N-acetyltransferase n=1 Tax=Amycolatopsis sp. H20-H5 TaxID=3046309 RepID=UPI002DBC4EEB|nr:GNAT family N-acetyltransferase [Amycolatopsis sp. H20-H5]MEC3977366.1 GNAT family N-acetyltransferase [Amycolatopsis sp. H20-H5]
MTETELIELRPWAEGDLPLLRRTNTPEMWKHLGGPESEQAVLDRHQRFLELNGSDAGRMYVILVAGQPAGSVGYWEKDWEGEEVYETGWHVLPEFQGRGVATRAAVELARFAAVDGTREELHAFPPLVNAASGAVCRRAGFGLRGECDFEFPKGSWIRCEDWFLPLVAPS